MSNAKLGEFELIRRYFAEDLAATGASDDASVALGIGDDCALLIPPAGEQMALSVDTLVEGTHFLPGTAPEHLATRLLGASVSDLAAMGARPAWFTLALTLPEAGSEWLEPFARSLKQTAERFSIRLVGGDTTRGPLSLSAQVHGFVPAGAALRRDGAAPGDLICVTGTLGDSRAGLETLLRAEPVDKVQAYLQQRFFAPEPRLTSGIALRGIASACIDISDGLQADLGHILTASGLGADLDTSRLALSEPLCAYASEAQARKWALTGGEDFELCFTVPAEKQHLLSVLPDPVTVVGQISQTPGLRLDGQPVQGAGGFEHFHRDSE